MNGKKKSGLVRCTCKQCLREFMYHTAVEYCPENSTCRVKAHQARKRIEELGKRLTLDMDYFIAYQSAINVRPTLKPLLDAFVIKHSPEIAKENLHIILGILEGKW